MTFAKQFFISTGREYIFEPEYQSVLDYAASNSFDIPSGQINIRNNNRIKFLKNENLWDNWDLLYFFDQETGRSDFAKINIINPSSNYLSFANEPSFIGGSGFKGNGIDQAFNTDYKPFSDKINLADNSGAIIYKGFDFIEDSNLETVCGVRIGNTDKQIMIQSNDASLAIFRNQITTGEFGFGKTINNLSICFSSTDIESRVYRNGLSFFARPGMSGSGFENLDLTLFAINDDSTLLGYMKSGLKYWGIGSDVGTFIGNNNPLLIKDILEDEYIP